MTFLVNYTDTHIHTFSLCFSLSLAVFTSFTHTHACIVAKKRKRILSNKRVYFFARRLIDLLTLLKNKRSLTQCTCCFAGQCTIIHHYLTLSDIFVVFNFMFVFGRSLLLLEQLKTPFLGNFTQTKTKLESLVPCPEIAEHELCICA